MTLFSHQSEFFCKHAMIDHMFLFMRENCASYQVTSKLQCLKPANDQ